MDTDGNRPNVADLTAIEGNPDTSAPFEAAPLWKAGMRRILFSASVAALGVLVSSVVVGVCYLWHSISTARAEYNEHRQAIADLRREKDTIRRRVAAEIAANGGEPRAL
jgi:hypothetical protein